MKAKSILRDPPKEGGPDDLFPEFICLRRTEDGITDALVVAHPSVIIEYGWTHWVEMPELD